MDKDIKMKIENENLNNSLKKSIKRDKMYINNEFNKKSINYNDSDISNGDINTTSNSNNIENDGIKQKERINKKEIEYFIVEKDKIKINKDVVHHEIYIKSNEYLINENEYIDDILYNLLEEEKNIKYEINPNYFNFQNEINQKMRSILIDWLIDVGKKFNLREETFYHAIYIIDNYLSKKIIKRKSFQLLGITSLLIASKFNEIYLRKTEDYSFITNLAYNIEEIKLMEKDITKTLSFNFLIPTCLSFYEIISLKLGFSHDINKFNFGQFLMQTFLIDFRSLFFSYSNIACAACYIVMKFYKMKNYKSIYNSKFFSVKNDNLYDKDACKIKECAKVICDAINEIIHSNFKSTIKKFSKNEFYELIKNILIPCRD